MPTVFLPDALAKELHCNSVEYNTTSLLERPGTASLLSRILQKCDVEDEDDTSGWVIVNNTRDKVLDEAELRSLHPSARVHLSRAGEQLPPDFVELRTMTTTAIASSEGRQTQAYVSAEPSHDFLDFLCVCVRLCLFRGSLASDAQPPAAAMPRCLTRCWSGWTTR